MVGNERHSRLVELIVARGASGFEHEAQDLVASLMTGLAVESRDAFGNLWASLDGEHGSPRLLLEAHVDEIALAVSDVLPGGLLAFSGAESWLPGSLVSQRVDIQVDGHVVPGVIASRTGFYAADSGADASPWGDLFIDVGASDEQQVEAMGIRPGSPVLPVPGCYFSADGRAIFGKALDNRVGVGVMLEVFREAVGRHRRPNSLIVASTTQEEIGSRGVVALEASLRADAAIVFEAIAARDTSRAAGGPGRPAQGGGPVLVAYDDGMISDPAFLNWAYDLAKSIRVPAQVARAYGTNDAMKVQSFWGGIPTIVIGVPCRHIHTPIGSMRLDDYEHTISLAAAIVASFDADALGAIRRGDRGPGEVQSHASRT